MNPQGKNMLLNDLPTPSYLDLLSFENKIDSYEFFLDRSAAGFRGCGCGYGYGCHTCCYRILFYTYMLLQP
jgi:hypothetical protein